MVPTNTKYPQAVVHEEIVQNDEGDETRDGLIVLGYCWIDDSRALCNRFLSACWQLKIFDKKLEYLPSTNDVTSSLLPIYSPSQKYVL